MNRARILRFLRVWWVESVEPAVAMLLLLTVAAAVFFGLMLLSYALMPLFKHIPQVVLLILLLGPPIFLEVRSAVEAWKASAASDIETGDFSALNASGPVDLWDDKSGPA